MAVLESFHDTRFFPLTQMQTIFYHSFSGSVRHGPQKDHSGNSGLQQYISSWCWQFSYGLSAGYLKVFASCRHKWDISNFIRLPNYQLATIFAVVVLICGLRYFAFTVFVVISSSLRFLFFIAGYCSETGLRDGDVLLVSQPLSWVCMHPELQNSIWRSIFKYSTSEQHEFEIALCL